MPKSQLFSRKWPTSRLIGFNYKPCKTDSSLHPQPLRDLAASIFSILPHTPVTGLVMLRIFHIKMKSKEAWNKLGHILAPKEPWTQIIEGPGLRDIMMEGRRNQTSDGTLRVKVQPSVRVEFGVYIEVSEEFKATAAEAIGDIPWVPTRLGEHWDAIMAFAVDTATHLIGLVKN
jgi:hypothetical protein